MLQANVLKILMYPQIACYETIQTIPSGSYQVHGQYLCLYFAYLIITLPVQIKTTRCEDYVQFVCAGVRLVFTTLLPCHNVTGTTKG